MGLRNVEITIDSELVVDQFTPKELIDYFGPDVFLDEIG
jgi:hypothetical protein